MNEPFELLPGRTYVLEHPHCLSEKIKDRLLERLYSQTRGLHCKFIILDGGVKIAREEKQEENHTKPWGSHQDWLDLIHETLNK
jgi:hypothetical protein